MDDFKLKHLPLLSEGIYRCLISEKDLLAMPDPAATIGEPILFAPSVMENTHIHEALALIARYQLSLLPVVTPEGEYQGAITRDKLIDILSELCNGAKAYSPVSKLFNTGSSFVMKSFTNIILLIPLILLNLPILLCKCNERKKI